MPWGSAPVAGNLLVIVVEAQGSPNGGITSVGNTAWTRLTLNPGPSSSGTNQGSDRYGIWWRVSDGSEQNATYVISNANGPVYGGFHWMEFVNVDTPSAGPRVPIYDVVAQGSGSFGAPSVTPAQAARVYWLFKAANAAGANHWGVPGGLTAQSVIETGSDPASLVAYASVGAGAASGTKVATLTGGGSNSEGQAFALYDLNTAPVVSGLTPTGALGNAKPTLGAIVTDAEGNNSYAYFQVATDTGFTNVVFQGQGNTVASGSASTIVATGLAASTTYYYRAYASDGSLSSGYSAYQSFTTSAPLTTNFTYTGGVQTFIVPANVTAMTLECWGAQGAALTAFINSTTYPMYAGLGGYAKSVITTTPGETLRIRVGGAGSGRVGGWPDAGSAWQQTGNATGGGGGGSSDVRRSADAVSDRLCVGGGGGGAPASGGGSYGQSGGAGGGSVGGDGTPATGSGYFYSGGFGGTQSAGGAAGGGGNVGPISAGSQPNGSDGSYSNGGGGGGGGGGGYWGGSGGSSEANTNSSASGKGGGGGSGYAIGAGAVNTAGVRSGSGQVSVTYPNYAATANSTPGVPTAIGPTGALTNAKPTLVATVTDPDGGYVNAFFQVATDTGFTNVVFSGQGSTTTSGGASSLVTTGLQAATVYYVRAYGTDGSLSSAYSAYSSFTTSAAITQSFVYTGGAQTFTVPAGITQATLECYGAQGGGQNGVGGAGGYAKSVVAVTPGEALGVYVGGVGRSQPTGINPNGGWNGGGNSRYGSGGGASDVRQSGSALTNRVCVGGGGGGAGIDVGIVTNRAGGVGGGATGGAGAASGSGAGGGGGGTQSAGGAGGAATNGSGYSNYNGTAGALGVGGNAFGAASSDGGGGGGGYYGGGGGSTVVDNGSSWYWNAGGGGGSSYVVGTGSTTTSGVRSGDGLVVVSYPNYVTTANTAPNAPALTAPTAAAIVPAGPTTLSWVFSDPDAGASQGGYALRVVDPTGATLYWNASTQTFQAGAVINPTASQSVLLPAGALFGGAWTYTVSTTDQFGLQGAYATPVAFTVAGGFSMMI